MKAITAALLCATCLVAAAQVLPFLIDASPAAMPEIDGVSLDRYPGGYDRADFVRAERYSRPLVWGGILNETAECLGLLFVLSAGIAHWFERRAAAHGSNKSPGRWLFRVLFLVAVFYWLRILDFPFLCWRHVHSLEFGLTHLGPGAWLKVLFAGAAVPLVMFVLTYLMVFCAMPLSGRMWWVVSAALIFTVFGLAPEVISRTYPLSPVETLTPLREGPHLRQLEAVAERAGTSIPFAVADRSRRSEVPSIYVAGRIGRQYVVLTDTFLRDYTPDEAGTALAHELGHARNRMAFVIGYKGLYLLKLLIGFWLAFILTGRKPILPPEGLQVTVVVLLCLFLSSFLVMPASNAISRWEERMADRYALGIVDSPAAYERLLVKFAKHNMEQLEAPPLQYYLFSSHPTTIERVRNARASDVKSDRPSPIGQQ